MKSTFIDIDLLTSEVFTTSLKLNDDSMTEINSTGKFVQLDCRSILLRVIISVSAIFMSAAFNMKVSFEDGLDAQEILYILCQTFIIVIISFIHPWLAPRVEDKVKSKMRNSVALTILFVFCIAFSYTVNFIHSLMITVMFFYVKSLLIKTYS
jgi:Kef-type K+ transport system membrane component KefB